MLLRKVWTFLDGDWPLAYKDKESNNYEALMIINPNKESANLQIKVFFEGQNPNNHKPYDSVAIVLQSEKILCFRLGRYIGEQASQKSKGKFQLVIESELPVGAQFGHIDLLQPNLTFYNIPGYSLG